MKNDLLENYTIFEPVLQIRPEVIKIGKGARIDSFVKLEGGQGIEIGEFVHIASFAHIGIGGGYTILEDYVAVASGGKVISGSNMVDALSMSAVVPPHMQRIERKTTRLCKYACVFTNGVVYPGVTMHEGAILAAGSVAVKDVPAWEIWSGNPAKFWKKRDIRP